MSFILVGTLLAIFIGLVLGSVRRDREEAAKVRAVHDRISNRYKPDQIFVSEWDQSAIAVSFERGVLVLGDASTDAEYPFTAIAAGARISDGYRPRSDD